ncbi:hypothetical protein DXT99_12115 [Pontibacter diazotrophicus]|uniref:Uncharacterized protein n=1 Tax=Pontibacter diazotrophicus TaxID=1400979 RepID=A0A3D8LC54_9BACT|nr:hypothetical protein [Pontibacter diazotrophicus]RDV15019.1 hypothetical protein DXT99_12115 [Pontibacter diazotrophicus]
MKYRNPPLLFRELLPLVKGQNISSTIDSMLELKASVNEKYLHPKEVELEVYLKSTLYYCEQRQMKLMHRRAKQSR